jgi:hypothetical protein
MALRFPPRGTPEYFRYIESIQAQHHTDIQRLWNVIPQIPDQTPGVPFTGPLVPTWFTVPSSMSSSAP